MRLRPTFLACNSNLIVGLLVTALASHVFGFIEDEARPNIIWLSAEDIGPQLSCYGDTTATTPAIDSMAKRGVVYDVAWSNYPVCAPARTTIITGMYAGSLGAGNMRSLVPLPTGVKLFPEYLRDAGYYCSNNNKEDYNVIKQGRVWDDSSRKAHYRNRTAKQPFFAVFNYTGTHESKIRVRPHEQQIDPVSVKLPSYWPDVPQVRQDWAQYYDNLQSLDRWIGKKLDELAAAGLAGDTIVFFFGDHGSGMPRHKRFAGDSGMHVPFVIHVPEKFKRLAPNDYDPGGHSGRLIGFVDLAPTMLSLAGLCAPEYMEGHAFMGEYRTDPQKYLFGYRERMDERPDLSRSIRDDRFVYIRNYMPHLPDGQFLRYQQQTPTTAIWLKMFGERRLNAAQSRFWEPHPPEELYDLKNDPEETVNLAKRQEFSDVLARFQRVHENQVRSSNDLGFLHEGDLFELSKTGPPGRIAGTSQYPIGKVLQMANLATGGSTERGADSGPPKDGMIDGMIEGLIGGLIGGLNSPNRTVRYWASLGLRIRGQQALEDHREELVRLLEDPSPGIAIVAAETLVMWGDGATTKKGLAVLARFANFENSNPFFALYATNAIDRLDDKAISISEALEKTPLDDGLKRGGGYLKRMIPEILSNFSLNRR